MSPRCTYNCDNIRGIDAATRHQDNPSSGRLHQARQRRKGVDGARFAARCEEARCSGLDHILERIFQVSGGIECPMKRDRQGMSQFHQGSGVLDVDTAVFVQYAQNHTIHTDLLGGEDIVAHDLKFGIGVIKAAGSRPNQNMDGSLNAAASGLHESCARSDTTRRQVTAKFDSVRTPALRRDGVVDRLYTNFKDKRIRHDLRD